MSHIPKPDECTRSNRLPILASTINDHLAAAEAATRRGLDHAIAAGILLTEAKELVGHGGWLPWLKANCHVGVRQAQVFMRLARRRDRLEAVKYAPSAHLTIHAAEAVVGRPRPERPRGLPGQLDLLDGSEVSALPAAPAVFRGRALFDRIVDLEQALAIVLAQDKRRHRNGRKVFVSSGLRAVASTIAAEITDLKQLYLRRRSGQRRSRRPERAP